MNPKESETPTCRPRNKLKVVGKFHDTEFVCKHCNCGRAEAKVDHAVKPATLKE